MRNSEKYLGMSLKDIEAQRLEAHRDAVKSQLGMENDMMQIVENESITGYPIVKNANKPIDFAKMEQLRDVFGTDVPFRLVDNKPYWGARTVLTILGFSNTKKVLIDNSCGNFKLPQVVESKNGTTQTRELNFISIEDINKIILNSRKSNPMIDKWKETNRTISGEAVKSQLGIENDIDKMVNERVEKAIALQNNNNNATMALCNNMAKLLDDMRADSKRSDMLLVQMQEDSRRRDEENRRRAEEDSKRRDEENKRRDEENRRRDEENKHFYAELFGKTSKLEDKVATVNPYRLTISEIADYIPGYNASTLNKLLIAYEYLYKSNGVFYPTDKMNDLKLCKDSGNKYHTLCYKDEMIEFAKNLVEQYKIDNEMY